MASGTGTKSADVERLHQLGYAQELRRRFSWFSNFAISFSIISILAGGFTGFWIGAAYGGPLVVTIGWLVVGLFALLVGMAMGEICSAYPTAGGLYFWSAKLATKNAPVWSWFTGWFNFIGQIGVIASVDYALANYVVRFINLYSSSAEQPIIEERAMNFFIVFLVMLLLHGLLHGQPRPRYGVYAPVCTPAGMAFFGRDSESTLPVWSARDGYPGQAPYREFHRDLGWDLSAEELAKLP